MSEEHVDHTSDLPSLKRIEGQVRGVQKMVQEKKYCVDILNQIHAVIGALARVEDKILSRHLENCVKDAVKGKSELERSKKLEEIITLLHKMRRL